MLQIRNVLHPTDFSPASAAALKEALFLARRHQAVLHLLHVTPVLGEDPIRGAYEVATDEEAFYRAARDESDRRMQELLEAHGDPEVSVKRVHTRGPAPGPVVLEYAQSEAIDLIAMGTHGRRGMRRLLLGSVTEEVLNGAGCPVLVTSEARGRATTEDGEKHGPILVPVAFSVFLPEMLAHASALAALYDAPIELLHVVDAARMATLNQAEPFDRPGVEHLLHEQSEERLRRLAAEAGVEAVRVEVQDGHPPTVIAEVAERHGARLIVMASHTKTNLHHFPVGSVADRVLRLAPCPVFLIKPLGKLLASFESIGLSRRQASERAAGSMPEEGHHPNG